MREPNLISQGLTMLVLFGVTIVMAKAALLSTQIF